MTWRDQASSDRTVPAGSFFKRPRAEARAEAHLRKQARLKAQRLERARESRKRRDAEIRNKQIAKGRDRKRCRFPLCGCGRISLRVESSHDRHKGHGGDPTGQRSRPEVLLTLCVHRHQDGRISRHKQTLRTRYLTSRKNDGPVAFEVKREALPKDLRHKWMFSLSGRGWVELARERDVQQLEPLEPWQKDILECLAEMAW